MSKRGAITLVFDDGYEAVFKKVVPLLNQYHVPAVFAVPLEFERLQQETHEPLTPWQEWLTVRNTGHELAAHSVHHIDLTTLADQPLTDELSLPIDNLQATTLVYPGGAYNQQVINHTKNFYTHARTVDKGFNQLPPKNPYTLKTYNFTKNNYSVTKANLLALYAYLTNHWLIETYHLVDDQSSDMLHSVQLAAFTKHLKFITRLPLEVITIDSVS